MAYGSVAGQRPLRNSVFGDRVVDFVGPGKNASFDALGIFEPLLFQELHGLEGTHAALAMDIERLVGVQVGKALGQGAQRDQRHAQSAGGGDARQDLRLPH